MPKRLFRTVESIDAETATRAQVETLLVRHGFTIVGREQGEHGTAITQVIEAQIGDGPVFRMHVRLCWRRGGRRGGGDRFSGVQLKARKIDDDWDKTLAFLTSRYEREGYSHLLFVQDGPQGFVFAAIVPSAAIPGIWRAQRDLSADLIAKGLVGSRTKNHAANGDSPTLWLQDDRYPATPAVADVLWKWPGVINVLARPRAPDPAPDFDSVDDLPWGGLCLGRDVAGQVIQIRSGYPRDPAVRAAVRARANGHCERTGCTEHRNYAGFLDVHHIFGVQNSDRIWTCVALCPNCHREAHFAPDRDAINESLRIYASSFEEQGR